MKFNRHDLIYVEKNAVDVICCKLEREGAPQTLLSRLGEIPFIIKQQGKTVDRELEVGISLPFFEKGVRMRRQGIVSISGIVEKISPYMVAEKFYKSGSIMAVDRLIKVAESYGGNLGIFGSLALELVSGMKYTHENSDVDFIVEGVGKNLLGFLDTYQTISDEIGVKMDGEVYFPSIGSVKILELLTESSHILVKGFYESFLLSREELEGYENT